MFLRDRFRSDVLDNLTTNGAAGNRQAPKTIVPEARSERKDTSNRIRVGKVAP
jgi:hypothetical protein